MFYRVTTEKVLPGATEEDASLVLAVGQVVALPDLHDAGPALIADGVLVPCGYVRTKTPIMIRHSKRGSADVAADVILAVHELGDSTYDVIHELEGVTDEEGEASTKGAQLLFWPKGKPTP